MSAVQRITPELRHWIAEQLGAGESPATLLQAMCSSGWSVEVAQRALDGAQQGGLRGGTAEMPAPVAVPEPLDAQGNLRFADAERASVGEGEWAADSGCAVQADVPDDAATTVRVLASLASPRIVVFGGLLSDAECDGLVALAEARLTRSETVDTRTGGSEVNDARTSEGMFFAREENPLCARIEQRIARLLAWPLEYGEGLQVLRYRTHAEYKPHYDYFDPLQLGTPAVLARGGQRVASLVMYLNTPPRGGATVFPDAHFNVAPIKGNAVFFSYDRPHPITRTLHGGAPVLEGEKWVATKWLRERRFD